MRFTLKTDDIAKGLAGTEAQMARSVTGAMIDNRWATARHSGVTAAVVANATANTTT